jgi:predicted homoserine dehydrogenase-like protein
LERFGGYTNYGVMELAEETRKLNALPAGLSPGAKMVKPVKAGEIVTWNDVALDEGSTVVKLRREQDALFST